MGLAVLHFQPYVHPPDFPKLSGEGEGARKRCRKTTDKGKEIAEQIEGIFERQNKLIARLEMELEALSNFNGKQNLDTPATCVSS